MTRAVLAALVLLAVGCGGERAPTRPAAAPSLKEAGKLLERESARIQVSGEFKTAEGPGLRISGSGVAGPDPYRAQVNFTYTTDEGVASWTAKKIGQERFLSSQELAALLPDNKQWLRASGVAGAPNVMVPYDYNDFLEGAKRVQRLESGEIRGQRVTHYHAEFDVHDAAEAATEASREFAQAMVGDQAMPVDVWLDGDGRPVRVQLAMRNKDGSSMTSRVDIVKWGVPVEVEPPPPALVAEESELSGS